MFTGIVETVGKLTELRSVSTGLRMKISAKNLDFSDVSVGDSVAVSGPCLTVVSFSAIGFEVDVSSETLSKTTLGLKKVGALVNIEKALKFNDRLGGHLVSGHIDGVGTVLERATLGDYVRFIISVPVTLSRYLAYKGSVCLDGVSLTVNNVTENTFEVLTIPHTLDNTTLEGLTTRMDVNVEVDLVARYLERLYSSDKKVDLSKVSLGTLVDAGIIK
jgi:riboflavin synthase